MKKEIKNKAASIRARLFNIAKTQNIEFDFILLRYFQERFLYRLSISPYANKFVLKGGLLLVLLNIPKTRVTIDTDFLIRQIKSNPETLTPIFKEIAGIESDDGIDFKPETISCEKIKEDADYEGLRFKLEVRLGQAKKLLQFDLGFGDIITPASRAVEFPVLLDGICAKLQAYPMETVIAEKFEAMVKLDIQNSRMKDFYDIYLISRSCPFAGITLSEAIQKTFKARGTEVQENVFPFSEEFYNNPVKQTQWLAFLHKSRITDMPKEFKQVVEQIKTFIRPITIAIHNKERFPDKWNNAKAQWDQ